MSKQPSAPDSVLVYVGLDRVGDALLKLPFVRGLRTAFPKAHITWLAGKETSVYASIMAPTVEGLLDEVIENAGIGHHPSELLRRALPGRRFDMIIDSQRIFWASLSLWRIPHRTFISPAAHFLISSRKPAKGYTFPKLMQRQLLDLLEIASGQSFPSPAKLDIDIPQIFHDGARKMMPEGPTYVALSPGAGGLPKCWPLDRFIAVAKAQVERGRIPAFLLGPQEEDWLPTIRDGVPEAVFPLQEKGIAQSMNFNPLLTIALAKHFTAALSNDSGTGHMLAVGGVPLVSLFGRTVPEKFMPMTDLLTIVRAQDFGGREMDTIPVEPVLDALEKALN